jgi:hypothetical protein
MGNSIGTTTKKDDSDFKNFYEIVDYVATHYILTMDFKSLRKLSEKAYCDKLVVLTSDIIDRYFNDMEVTFLAQRIKDGVEVNNLKTEKIKFINQDNLQSLDVSNDTQKSIRKKRVCIGIAKYYVKVAHVFAAIVTTINPVYMYKDSTGQNVKATLLEKDKIPKNVKRKLYKLNICDNRIRALKRGEQIDNKLDSVTINPRVCDMNINKENTQKTLADEPGIQELMRLYLDDKYDYSNGTFTGMSEVTEKQFRKDLKTFYTAFTGEKEMPDTIKKFSDIKLRDYSKKPGCQLPNPIIKKKYTLDKNDKLYISYAENIKKMIQNAADNQYKLLEVINDLFTHVNDPYSGKRVIRINPKLTDELLQKNVVKTRKLIIDLYVKCETDYFNGVQLFEAIVESKIVETTQKQIENLKKEASKIISQTTKSSEPVKQPAVVIVGDGISATSSSSATTTDTSTTTDTTTPTDTSTTSDTTTPTDTATTTVTPSTTTTVTPSTVDVSPPNSYNDVKLVTSQNT